jgi:hypothetical protein
MERPRLSADTSDESIIRSGTPGWWWCHPAARLLVESELREPTEYLLSGTEPIFAQRSDAAPETYRHIHLGLTLLPGDH